MQPLTTVPRVSVVIPVRNGRDYIYEALDSILGQSFKDFEIIVVDDGSSDFDYDTLLNYDSRIRVVHLDGKGVSHARNTGMCLARGDFFAFLDADDIWFPGKLAAQIRYFDAHPNVGVMYGKFTKWLPDKDGKFPPAETLGADCEKIETPEADRSGWVYTRLLMGMLVGMNTAVIRKSVYLQVGGFNEDMRIGEDYDFWLRASRVTEMHSLDCVVALYRIHPASAMHQINSANHMARLLNCAVSRWGTTNPDQTNLNMQVFKKRVAMTHFHHGYVHFWHGDATIAKNAFRLAAIGGENRLRAVIYFSFSWIRSLKKGTR